MYAFLLFFLVPLAAFASEFDDFLSRRVGECIVEMYELRSEEPRDSVTYQYLCGRLDSYYDVLYKIEQPSKVHQFDRGHLPDCQLFQSINIEDCLNQSSL